MRGIGQEETGVHFPSDSLFAALLVAGLELGVSPNEITRLFSSDDSNAVGAPFRLTSMFPRVGGLRFYPKLPLGWMFSQEKLDELHKQNRMKQVKKITFISKALFREVVKGQYLDKWLPAKPPNDATEKGLFLQNGLWLKGEEITQVPLNFVEKIKNPKKVLPVLREADIWKAQKVPHVAVDRLSNASSIFHSARLGMNEGCGFWFGIEWRAPDQMVGETQQNVRQIVEQALDQLADIGIRASRSSGYAKTEQHDSLPDVETGQMFVTLSRYNPRSGEMSALLSEQADYELKPVGGWVRSQVTADQRRRRLWLIQEGSVLQTPSKEVLGQLVDVQPIYRKTDSLPDPPPFPHPVWRYGLACPIGLARREGA